MKRIIGFLIVCALLIAAGVHWGKPFYLRVTGASKGQAQRTPSDVPVAAAVAVQKDVPVEIRTFGTVAASSVVEIKSQITGTLTDVPFQEGQDVKAADLLFVIDSRPWEVALKQAEANLARDTAQHANAVKEAARQEELLKKGFAAQDASDQARTAAETLAAVVQADNAAIENARIQLGYCSIRAPVGGRAGEIMVRAGNQIKANDATLVTLRQIRPVFVSFAVPQQELPEIRRQSAAGALGVRAFAPAAPDDVATGSLTFVDNTVDSNTGTIQLKGTFSNELQRLWPGQFVQVALTLATQSGVVVVPSRAIQTGQRGAYIFVIGADLAVTDRVVTVARIFNGDSVVSDGVRPGERVVTDGQLRLKPGMKVQIKAAPDEAGTPPK